MLKDSVKKFGVVLFPALYVIESDGTYSLLAEYEQFCSRFNIITPKGLIQR